MADVTVYKRSTMNYFWGTSYCHVGEVRVGTDPTVVANPQWWVALTDADLTSGQKGIHGN
jgi:hypothetical protein